MSLILIPVSHSFNLSILFLFILWNITFPSLLSTLFQNINTLIISPSNKIPLLYICKGRGQTSWWWHVGSTMKMLSASQILRDELIKIDQYCNCRISTTSAWYSALNRHFGFSCLVQGPNNASLNAWTFVVQRMRFDMWWPRPYFHKYF